MRNIIARCSLSLLLISTYSIDTAEAESQDDLLIIANQSMSISEIDIATARAILLKQRKQWPDGGLVIVVFNKSNMEAYQALLDRVLNMSPVEEQRYWQNLKIKNGENPPSEVLQIQKTIFKIKNSISFILRRDMLPGVTKVLLTVPPI